MTKSEIKTIAEATAGLYNRLSRGLEKITKKNGWIVLSELEYVDFLHLSDPNHLEEMEGRICPSNYVKQDGDNYFMCACGKKHISNLALFEYKTKDFEYIILGSECIKSADKFLQRVGDIDNFQEKVKKWLFTIKEEERKLKYNKCIACPKYAVAKNYEYKNPARKLWCKDCCSGGQIKCIQCGSWRLYAPDYRGKPMKYCISCYYSCA